MCGGGGEQKKNTNKNPFIIIFFQLTVAAESLINDERVKIKFDAVSPFSLRQAPLNSPTLSIPTHTHTRSLDISAVFVQNV